MKKKVAAYAAAVMAGLAIMVFGMAVVVTLQINLWLLPQEVGPGEMNPVFSFPAVVYDLALAALAILAGIFSVFAVLLRR